MRGLATGKGEPLTTAPTQPPKRKSGKGTGVRVAGEGPKQRQQ